MGNEIIRCTSSITFPGMSAISITKTLECVSYKIINLFLPGDVAEQEIKIDISFSKAILFLAKAKNNRYIFKIPKENNATDGANPEDNSEDEKWVTYRFNTEPPEHWNDLKEAIFVPDENSIKATFTETAIKEMTFKNPTGEPIQIELYMGYKKD